MSDLFDGANKAADAQINGINSGLSGATNYINQGQSALNSTYASALAPYQQNYTQAQAGTTALANLQGLNGASAGQQAQQTLQATPGYQFSLGQANNATAAQAAATGTTGSGNEALALQKNASGLASQTYNTAVSQLQPYLNQSNQAASGIASVNTGLGNQTNSNYSNLASLYNNSQLGIGNAQASADLANQSMDMSLLSGGLNLAGSIFSDERLKESIEPVGELFDGTNIYRYRYKGDDTPRIGVMAQEIEEKYPDAVSEHGGYKAVNYERATDLSAALAKFLDAA